MEKKMLPKLCCICSLQKNRFTSALNLNTRLLVTIFAAICLSVTAKAYGQKIDLNVKNESLEQVFKLIKEQSNYSFIWDADVLKKSNKVTISVKGANINQVLNECLKKQNLSYIIIDNLIAIKPEKKQLEITDATESSTNYIKIKGIVTNKDGDPLKLATVLVKGTNIGTQTNSKGEFAINKPEKSTLSISYVGYEKKEVFATDSSFLRIVLSHLPKELEDVRVEANTGYQKLPKDRITGSFDVITAKQVERKAPINLIERLEGLVPGLLLINGKDNGSPDGLTIRGISTLSGTKRPLIVVDNFPIEGDINSINPNDVASITVLKDAAAASIWGSRAANGVIVITTKNGLAGDVVINYRNTFQFSPKPDLNKMNRLSSADDVELTQLLQNLSFYDDLSNYPQYYSANPVNLLYIDSINKTITPEEYTDKINQLKKQDNLEQIKDYLMQTPFTQSHTISLNGGNDANQYYASLLYTGQRSYAIRNKSSNISAYLKNTTKINKKLSFTGSINYTKTENTAAPVDPFTILQYKPYSLLVDVNGKPLPILTLGDARNQNKSTSYTITQRKNWGLLDETYYPLLEINRSDITSNSSFVRIQGEMSYSFVKGITGNISYQFENGADINKDYQHQDNAHVAKLINDFTAPMYDDDGKEITNADGTLTTPKLYIPRGGIISETRRNYTAYTLRAVLKINKSIGENGNLSAVFGGEQRKYKTSSANLKRYGYNDVNLSSVGIDEQAIFKARGVLLGINSGFTTGGNYFRYNEDRFVSAFANAAYIYKNKYILSGSSRMDATNLFGTDPKYRYKPLWSTGLSWILSREQFLNLTFVQNLTLRTTYGINGNVPKENGPFVIAQAGTNYLTTLPSYTITSPANNQLSWEGTTVFNAGIDFSTFKRIDGKIDWYKKNSTKLLSLQAINPTYGFATVLLNTANMVNDGIEIELTSKNIKKNNFEWSTNLVFSYSKNKIVKVTTNELFNSSYYRAAFGPNGVFVKDYSYGSLFSFKFAGLTNQGDPQVYDEKNVISNSPDLLNSLDVLEYSGNSRPTSTASFGNQFRYKNIELSFMFMAYGSYFARHGIPIVVAGDVMSYNNIIKDAWKKPGDEAFTNIPSITANYNENSYYYRNYLNVNVFDASYIKLREVIVTYSLNNAILKKLKGIKSLQITAQGRNLWTLTKNKYNIDPEAFSEKYPTIPVMPTYILGLNVTL